MAETGKTRDETDAERLQRAERAFAAGDHRALLPLARALANAQAPEVAARARALLRVVQPDVRHAGVLIACALAFCAICWHYLRS